jgi:hypothetical protein
MYQVLRSNATRVGFESTGDGSDDVFLEHRAGVEPANAGFADLCVSHFATGARSKGNLLKTDDNGQSPNSLDWGLSPTTPHRFMAASIFPFGAPISGQRLWDSSEKGIEPDGELEV